MFGDFVNNVKLTSKLELSIYPISEFNLEAIKYLVENCERCNDIPNPNVSLATFNTSLWLGDFLDKYWDKISYVCTTPIFNVLKAENNEIVMKSYAVESKVFNTEEEIEKFFEEVEWGEFVIFTVTKSVDLSTMKTFYNIRYADIAEQYEVRDNKLKSILEYNNVKSKVSNSKEIEIFFEEDDDLFNLL